MTYTPLATLADLTGTPLNDVIRAFSSSSQQQNLITRGSRAVESLCGRRLTPFTITESTRAQNIDPAEQMDTYTPLDQTGMLGMSRAQSLGAADLVREFWLREFPPLWPDLWTGSITSITVYRAISGSQVITDSTTWQYETDRGHVRMTLGTYVPQGSTLSVVYSGGYSTVPDDLVQANLYKAAEFAILDSMPEGRGIDVDISELRASVEALIEPYRREPAHR